MSCRKLSHKEFEQIIDKLRASPKTSLDTLADQIVTTLSEELKYDYRNLEWLNVGAEGAGKSLDRKAHLYGYKTEKGEPKFTDILYSKTEERLKISEDFQKLVGGVSMKSIRDTNGKFATHKGMRDLIVNGLRDLPEEKLGEIKDTFFKGVMDFVFINPIKGEMRDLDSINTSLETFKESILMKVDQNLIEEIYQAEDVTTFIKENPENGESLFNKIMYNNFDLLINFYLRDSLQKDPLTQEWTIDTKNNSMERSELEDVSYADSFASLTGLVLSFVEATPKILKDKWDDTWVKSNSTINVNQLKNALAGTGIADIGGDYNLLIEKLERNLHNPVIAGLYIKFFSAQPNIVDGEEVHSLRSIVEKEKSGDTELFIKDTLSKALYFKSSSFGDSKANRGSVDSKEYKDFGSIDQIIKDTAFKVYDSITNKRKLANLTDLELETYRNNQEDIDLSIAAFMSSYQKGLSNKLKKVAKANPDEFRIKVNAIQDSLEFSSERSRARAKFGSDVINTILNISSNTKRKEFITLEKDNETKRRGDLVINKTNYTSPSFSNLIPSIESSTYKAFGVYLDPKGNYIGNADNSLNLKFEIIDNKIVAETDEHLSFELFEYLADSYGVKFPSLSNSELFGYLNAVKKIDAFVNVSAAAAVSKHLGNFDNTVDRVQYLEDIGYKGNPKKILKNAKDKGAFSPEVMFRDTVSKFAEIADVYYESTARSTEFNVDGNMMNKFTNKSMSDETDRRVEDIRSSETSILKSNKIVKGEWTILGVSNKDGYYNEASGEDESHMKATKLSDLLHLNVNGLFANSIISTDNANEIEVDPFVPADKSKYTSWRLKSDTSFAPVTKDKELDVKALENTFKETVVANYNQMFLDKIKKWNAVLESLGMSPYIKPFNTSSNWDLENPQHFADYIESQNLTLEDVQKTLLVSEFDYIQTDTGTVQIRPDFIGYVGVFNNQESLKSFLYWNAEQFANSLQAANDFKISPKLVDWANKRFKDPFKEEKGKKTSWGSSPSNMVYYKQGRVKVPIHPAMYVYLMSYMTSQNQIGALNLGTPFHYKYGGPSKIVGTSNADYFQSLADATGTSFVDMGKRTVALVSTSSRPLTQSLENGLPSKETINLLPKSSNIMYFNDFEKWVELFSDGSKTLQEVYDGGFFVSPLEVMRFMNSMGNEVGGFKSQILKDFTTDFDVERGVPRTEKKASFQMTLELMRLGQNNGEMDLVKLNKKMLSAIPLVPFIDISDPIVDIMGRFSTIDELRSALRETGELDFEEVEGYINNFFSKPKNMLMMTLPEGPIFNNGNPTFDPETGNYIAEGHLTKNDFNIRDEFNDIRGDIKLLPRVSFTTADGNYISKNFENMYEIFEELDGIDNDNVFEDILRIEEQHPEIANQYVTKIGLKSSVKVGDRKNNGNLYDAIQSEEKDNIVIDQVSNEYTGLQNNPYSDPENVIEKMSMITQKISALSFEGNSFEDVNKIFKAIEHLADHKVLNEIQYDAEFIRETALKNMTELDLLSALGTKLNDKNWELKDPAIFKQVIARYKSIFEKAAIRHKFSGGQYVLTPVSGIVKMHSLEYIDPEDEKRKETVPMLYPDYLKKERELTKKYGSLQYRDNLSDLKWVDYVKTNEFGDVQSIKKSDEYINLVISKDASVEQQVIAFNAYKNLLNSGEYVQTPGQILLPNVFKKFFNSGEVVSLQDVKDDPKFFHKVVLSRKAEYAKTMSNEDFTRLSTELKSSFYNLLKMDAARIPGTGKQSFVNVQVAGFIESLDNSIGVPIDSLVIKGEDFDIDKSFLQMMEVIPDGVGQGLVYPVYSVDPETGELLKSSSGNPISLNDLEKMPEEDLKFWLKMTPGSNKKLLYQGVLRNYVFSLTTKVSGDPSNAIESNTAVGISALKKYVTRDFWYNFMNPAHKELLVRDNKVGVNMIGIEAVALKGFSAAFHAAKMMQNSKVDVPFESFKFNGSKYSTMAGVDGKYKGIPVWRLFSELVNAATDNSKHLLLANLNWIEETATLANGLLAYGVPMKQIVKVLKDEEFIKVFKKASFGSKLTEDDLAVIYPYSMRKKDIENLATMTSRFSDLSNSLGINQGLPSTAEDIHKYLKTLLKWDSNAINVATDDYYAPSEAEVRDPISAYNILKFNTHYKGMVKAAVKLSDTLEKEFPNVRIANALSDIKGTLKKSNSKIVKAFHIHAQEFTDKLLYDHYLKDKVVTVNDIDFEMAIPKDRLHFIDRFDSSYISDLKERYPNNHFIKLINKDGKKSSKGLKKPVYGLIGFLGLDSAKKASMQLHANKLPAEVRRNLFIYDSIVYGGKGHNSFSSVLVEESFNSAMKTFKPSLFNIDHLFEVADTFFIGDYPLIDMEEKASLMEATHETKLDYKYVIEEYEENDFLSEEGDEEKSFINHYYKGKIVDAEAMKLSAQLFSSVKAIDGTVHVSYKFSSLKKSNPSTLLGLEYLEKYKSADPVEHRGFSINKITGNTLAYTTKRPLDIDVPTITTKSKFKEMHRVENLKKGQTLTQLWGSSVIKKVKLEKVTVDSGSDFIAKVTFENGESETFASYKASLKFVKEVRAKKEVEISILGIDEVINNTFPGDSGSTTKLKRMIGKDTIIVDEQQFWKDYGGDFEARNKALASVFETFIPRKMVVYSKRFLPKQKLVLANTEVTKEGFKESRHTPATTTKLSRVIIKGILKGNKNIVYKNSTDNPELKKIPLKLEEGKWLVNTDHFDLDTPVVKLAPLFIASVQESNPDLFERYATIPSIKKKLRKIKKGDGYAAMIVIRTMLENNKLDLFENGVFNEFLNVLSDTNFNGIHPNTTIGMVGSTQERSKVDKKILKAMYGAETEPVVLVEEYLESAKSQTKIEC